MEIILWLCVIIVTLIFIESRKVKLLNRITKSFENQYTQRSRERLESNIKYSKVKKEIDFEKIYLENFEKILTDSQRYIQYFQNQASDNIQKIEVVLELAYSWTNSFDTLSFDKHIAIRFELIEDKKVNKLYVSATISDFLWLVDYLNELIKQGYDYEDNKKYTLNQLLSKLENNVVKFKEYWKQKRIFQCTQKLMNDYEEENKSYIHRLLELMSYNGKHPFDNCQDVQIFSAEEIETIKQQINIYFTLEILKHDFKYIGELISIIDKIKEEYLIKYDTIYVLHDLRSQLSLVNSCLIIALHKNGYPSK